MRVSHISTAAATAFLSQQTKRNNSCPRTEEILDCDQPALNAPPGRDAEAIKLLRDLGITHMLFERRSLPELGRHCAIAERRVIEERYALEYEDRNFLLYRL